MTTTRIFEDYELFKIIDNSSGISNVPDVSFRSFGAASAGYGNDLVSGVTQIGFDFLFDNITYKNFVASSSGWLALVDPSTNTFTAAEVLLDASTAINSSIRTSFTSDAVLLCPWFDTLMNVADDIDQLSTTDQVKQLILHGIIPRSSDILSVGAGPRYFYDRNNVNGRRLIVRWNSWYLYTTYNIYLHNYLLFEARLYENGTIEFGYAPRKKLDLKNYTNEGATTGIFMPNGTNRFRDFSYGLGYRDNERSEFTNGGAVYVSSYSDTSVDPSEAYTSNYSCNLKSNLHWPASDQHGCTLLFSPQKELIKKLPRKDIKDLSNSQLRHSQSTFNDQNSLLFSNSLLNYPSNLPKRFGGNDKRKADRQNLFSTTLNLSGAVSNTIANNQLLLTYDAEKAFKPFKDTKINYHSEGEFFTSSFQTSVLNVKSTLRDKEKIVVTLPIKFGTIFPLTNSCMYYYNARTNQICLPENSVSGEDLSNPYFYSVSASFVEDARGFNALGVPVSSGSNVFSGLYSQTDALIGVEATTENITNCLTKKLNKTFTINNSYNPKSYETFSLNIDKPFLLEKATVEIPFAAGDSWFADKTTTYEPYENVTGSFDLAGPALTVALLNQNNVGNDSYRDIIFSGTITHEHDNVNEMIISRVSTVNPIYKLRKQGFLSFSTPSCVVNSDTSLSGHKFSGSVIVNCVPAISNGVVIKTRFLMSSSTGTNNVQGILDLFNLEKISLKNENAQYYGKYVSISQINSLGKSLSCEKTGRSQFGNEFVSFNDEIINPFYVEGAPKTTVTGTIIDTEGKISSEVVDVINSTVDFHVSVSTAVNACGNSVSPCILHPDDKFVLTLSKTRPFLFGTISGEPVPYFSGTNGHDVSVLPGEIKLTLYGSYLKENKETILGDKSYDGTKSIYSKIGDQVLDQHYVYPRKLFVSGCYDNYISGKLVEKTLNAARQIVFTTGSRGLLFSKNNSRSTESYPGTSEYDYSIYESKCSQQFFEKAGLPISSHISINETFYDSYTPGISDLLKVDGSDLYLTKTGDESIFDLPDTGVILLDNCYLTMSLGNTDNILTKSFPYESRYSRCKRYINVNTSMITKNQIDLGFIIDHTDPEIVSINPKQVKGVVINHFGKFDTKSNLKFSDQIKHGNLYSDGIVNQTFDLASNNINDTVKLIFGFGDINNVTGSLGNFGGSNHFADYRTYQTVTYYKAFIGPIIRGWKYGVLNGEPTPTKAYYRLDKYGQFRDMLEQRQLSKLYVKSEGMIPTITRSPISVKFVDYDGMLTSAESTWCQNLSFEATSSVPFIDNEARNRAEVNVKTLNSSIISMNTTQFDNVEL